MDWKSHNPKCTKQKKVYLAQLLMISFFSLLIAILFCQNTTENFIYNFIHLETVNHLNIQVNFSMNLFLLILNSHKHFQDDNDWKSAVPSPSPWTYNQNTTLSCICLYIFLQFACMYYLWMCFSLNLINDVISCCFYTGSGHSDYLLSSTLSPYPLVSSSALLSPTSCWGCHCSGSRLICWCVCWREAKAEGVKETVVPIWDMPSELSKSYGSVLWTKNVKL